MIRLHDRLRSDNREKGVLLPIFSLPSEYGIGCFSEEARRFIDWLAATGHSYWQILPLNPTGCGDSPYQPLSSFAGNEYFIDPAQLIQAGYLRDVDIVTAPAGNVSGKIDYTQLYDGRMQLLRLAFGRWNSQASAGEKEACEAFAAEQKIWLEDYALFRALREVYGRELSWDEWPEPLRNREKAALEQARREHEETIAFYRWAQYEFYRQWAKLKEHAARAGVKIIGDMPIYVSYDSSDCWADPGQFQMDERLEPVMIAGVPPDAFTEEGQLWGNPLYDWEKMKLDGYSWWIRRIRQCFMLYDVIRLDHFRGFEAYYAVPADAENAIHGIWKKGPGMDLFQRLGVEMGSTDLGTASSGSASVIASSDKPTDLRKHFIAEDLGFLTEDVKRLLAESGFPGTKVIQFAFDGDPFNAYLPENYGENCVVYTGTHDNDTTAGWFAELSEPARSGIFQYLGHRPQKADALAAGSDGPALATAQLVEKALDSRANIAVIPLQDYLQLGSCARINVPGTVGDNWCWRATKEMFVQLGI